MISDTSCRSAARRRRRKRGRKGHYHTGTHVSPKAGACKFRSGWEQLYMLYLDADVNVTSYSYESVCIPYVSNLKSGRQRKYYPDFLVHRADGSRILVEIKPKKRLDQATVKKKLAAARAWCSEHGVLLEIVTEDSLRLLKLLK